MKFIDYAKIYIRSGNGGAGCLSFRREKFIPKGGPDGGCGGKGGDVYVKATESLTTLIDFKYKQHYNAKRGEDGGSNNKTGASGEDITLLVPVGTVIIDSETKEQIKDLSTKGEVFLLAKGGNAGRGNQCFTSSINQAPKRFELGEQGEEKIIVLELKVIADIGIIGFPNVGKSTFISAISNARPKIADYPFTTLRPNLGIVKVEDYRSFVIADLPGLVEGASAGIGLGHRFLKHAERTKYLFHFLDMSLEPDENIKRYEVINKELQTYSKDLASKRQIVVLNKCDVLSENGKVPNEIENYFKKKKIKIFPISAVARTGLQKLIYYADSVLRESLNK
ncbi:MAG: GTPase ObgE [Pseudomonadota bacterium]